MTETLHTWRLLCRFTLRSPLSHVAETISTTAYLNQEPVLQPDGTVEEVFVYNGNSWRGQLRDLIATYFLEHVGSPQIGLDAFHLLYSGGSIGGNQQTDIAQARAYRRLIPPIALLGGGIGNQILPGKLRVSNFYPVCREAPPSLYPVDPDERARISYRALTMEKSYSRKDDSKNPLLATALEPRAPAQATMALGDGEETKPKRGRDTDAPAQQMRMTVEVVIAGTQLVGHMDLLDATEVELGCLVSGLHQFARSPHIGGQASRGLGLVTLETTLVDLDTGAVVDPFVTVTDHPILSPPAEQAKAAYDHHVRQLYDAMLASQEAEVRRMIGATV